MTRTLYDNARVNAEAAQGGPDKEEFARRRGVYQKYQKEMQTWRNKLNEMENELPSLRMELAELTGSGENS